MNKTRISRGCGCDEHPFATCKHRLFVKSAADITAAQSGCYRYANFSKAIGLADAVIIAIMSSPGIDSVRISDGQNPMLVLANPTIQHLFINAGKPYDVRQITIARTSLQSLSIGGFVESGTLDNLWRVANLRRLGLHVHQLSLADVALIALLDLDELDIEESRIEPDHAQMLIATARARRIRICADRLPTRIEFGQLTPYEIRVRSKEDTHTRYFNGKYKASILALMQTCSPLCPALIDLIGRYVVG